MEYELMVEAGHIGTRLRRQKFMVSITIGMQFITEIKFSTG